MSDLPIVPGVEFRPIPEFLGYSAGDDGSIWSSLRQGGGKGPWHRMKTKVTVWGYEGVILMNSGTRHDITVHRLVLSAFVGACPDGMECRHLNGNRLDNRIANLAWGTKSENVADRKRHGTFLPPPLRPKGAGTLLGDRADIGQILQLRSEGLTFRAIGQRVGLAHSTIGRIVRQSAGPA
jgi:hypothetical protein